MKIVHSAISFHQILFSQHMTQAQVPILTAKLGFEAVEWLDVSEPLPAGAWTGTLRRRLWYIVKHDFPSLPHSSLPSAPKRYDPTIALPLREAADRAAVKMIGWTIGTDLRVQGEAL